MQPPQARQPYVHFLLISGGMTISFLLLYSLAQTLACFPLMLAAMFFACLCLLLEVLLGVVAAARGQLLLAFLYGLVSVALFFADRWLLEQAE